MIIRNDLKKSNAYKVALYKYRQRTKNRHLPEIIGFSGAAIILAVLIFNGTFTAKEFIVHSATTNPFEFGQALLILLLGIPAIFTFFLGMFGNLNVYEIHVDDVKTISKSSTVSGDKGYVEDTTIYENGIQYHFTGPCSFNIEKGKSYFVAGKGTKLFFVISEKR